MNRKTPMQEADPVRLVGLQTLLIGLEATLDGHVSNINDVRSQLGHPRIAVLRNALPPSGEPPVSSHVPERQQRQLAAPESDDDGSASVPFSQGAAKKKRHKNMGRKANLSKKVAGIWQAKRDILEAAGMNQGVRGMPSNKLIAKAIRKLQRLGLPIPGTEVAERPKKKAAKRVAKKAAKTTAAARPVDPVRHQRMKDRVGESSAARWALAKKAGLKPTTVPGKEMLDEARKILAAQSAARKNARLNKSSKAVKAAVTDMKQTQARETVNVPVDLPQQVVEPAI